MGLFDGINTATSTRGGVYLKAPPTGSSLYQVSITKCEMFKTRKGVEAFIANFIVVASNNADCPVGLKAGWFNGSDKDAFLGNLADFSRPALTAYGWQKHGQWCEPDLIPITADLQHQINTTDMLVGVQLEVQTTMIKTKAQKDFTLHKWSPAKNVLPVPELKAA